MWSPDPLARCCDGGDGVVRQGHIAIGILALPVHACGLSNRTTGAGGGCGSVGGDRASLVLARPLGWSMRVLSRVHHEGAHGCSGWCVSTGKHWISRACSRSAADMHCGLMHGIAHGFDRQASCLSLSCSLACPTCHGGAERPLMLPDATWQGSIRPMGCE